MAVLDQVAISQVVNVFNEFVENTEVTQYAAQTLTVRSLVVLLLCVSRVLV